MLMAFFVWWYTGGWQRQISLISQQLDRLLDMFSFDLLLRTLFSPFRQISAGSVGGPLGVQLQAWLDRVVSRLIGAMVRTVVLITGVIVVVAAFVCGGIRFVLWPLVPIAPIIGFVLWLSGWIPWN